MDKKKLDGFKKRLETRQQELRRMVSRTQQDGRAADEDVAQDIADKAASSYNKEFLFHQSNADRQLLQTLERYGVKAVDTTDGKLDPNLHQAIAEVPGNGKPPGSIVDVVQAGFTIGDRLLRPAMVTVAKKDMPAQPAGVDTKA